MTKTKEDERLIHRLEAFSDIVIGFCIAELGLSLRVPGSVAALAHTPMTVVQFGVAFILIASLWGLHNRLFANYFVPNRVSITLNFFMLAALILTVYFFQTLRSLGSVSPLPAAYCLASFGVVYLLLGVMWALGSANRWAELSDTLAQQGVRRAGSLIIIGGSMFAFGATLVMKPQANIFEAMLLIAIISAAYRAVAPHIIRRWLR